MVHNRAWSKWKLASSELAALALPDGVEAQAPGEVPWDVINELKASIDALPKATKKPRKLLDAETPAGKRPKNG